MLPETHQLDAVTIEHLEALVTSAGGRRQMAIGMAIANGSRAPNQGEIDAQMQRLRRILNKRQASVRSLGLIAAALSKALPDLLRELSVETRRFTASDRSPATAQDHDEIAVPSARSFDPKTADGHLYALLNKISNLTAHRTNIVRDEPGLSLITLQDELYVQRDIESGVLRTLQERGDDAPFIVIEGEAGTGKSSILWSLERRLRALGAEVWLVDAAELATVLGQGGTGTILPETFRELCRRLAADRNAPILLIDTVDVPLNTSGGESYISSLIIELAMADVTVVAASRPGESRMLRAHEPRRVLLFDYSDDEFPRAVAAYAKAYVPDGDRLTPEAHAERLFEAAAQGYPIKEICRNPLTLRMLYAIYAPKEINFPEVDVITLYREFWHRRVEADLRSDVRTSRGNLDDLSLAAMRIAAAMLVAGMPELPNDRLLRELDHAGLNRGQLEQLRARGVLRVSNIGPHHLVDFFHQTFFEHTAALAILRLGMAPAVAALARRWEAFKSNLFLGAVLERVLVLSEYEPQPVRKMAERIAEALQGASGEAIQAYLFVHRLTVPEEVARAVDVRVVAGDSLTIERLLAIGANAPRPRRAALIGVLGNILKREDSRWLRRAMELLLRFAETDLAEVSRVIRIAELGKVIFKDPSGYNQTRELYLRFVGLNFSHDPTWSLSELAQFLNNGLRRNSEQSCLDTLSAAATAFGTKPEFVRALEAQAGLERSSVASRATSESVARKMGDLIRGAWRVEGAGPAQAVKELTEKHGLAMTSRLHALGQMLLEATPAEVGSAFELMGEIQDPRVRIMAARIAWTRVFPLIIEKWKEHDVAEVMRRARALAGNVLVGERNGYADILYHVLRHGSFSRGLARYVLGEQALKDAGPWSDSRVLGHRVVQAAAAGIEGAQAAFDAIAKNPSEHQLMVPAVLAQLKASPISPDTQSLALRLAVLTNHSEAALDVLRASQVSHPAYAHLAARLQRMANALWQSGNPKTMRTGSALLLELVRLRLGDDLGWESIARQAKSDKDDQSLSLLIRALCITVERGQVELEPSLRWLLGFAKNKGPFTRAAILDLYSRISEDRPDIASEAIEGLFEIAFTEPTDGNLIEKLQPPLFSVYRKNDPRAVKFAEELIRRTAPLSPQTSHRVCGTFKRLFGFIVDRMDQAVTDRLLSEVPRLHPRLGRMIVEGVAKSGKEGLVAKMKAIAENSAIDGEITTLAGKFLNRDLRMGSGLEEWPELYDLIVRA